MKTIKFAEREEWLNWRLIKSTGSKLAGLFSRPKGVPYFDANDPKLGVFRLIAEGWIGSAALAEDDEIGIKAMERGSRLEPEAIQRFCEETGKKMVWHNDDTGWEREDDSRIAFSPDGSKGKTEAVEVKCLSAARHVQARIDNKIPKDYEWQALQAFVVNESLRILYFVFYDPRFPKGLDFFYFTVNRKDKKGEIEALLSAERSLLTFVREKTNELTKYLKAVPKAVAVGALDVDLAERAREIEENLSRDAQLERVHAGIKSRMYD